MAQFLDWFRQERTWINEQHLRLCRIPAPTFFEQTRAEWMAEQFREIGWQAKLDRAGNVIAQLGSSRDLPAVAVTAHLDTVLAPRSPEEIRNLGDGRLEGPGVADNGAGLTALLALAAAWKECVPLDGEELRASPVLIANVGEEGEGNLGGMRYVCRAGDSQSWKAFFVLDGPGVEHVTHRALASKRYEIQMTGAGGHSWRNAENANAVHALSRVVTMYADAFAPRFTRENARTTFNFGIIDGGISINSIPAEARTKLDLRSENADTLDCTARLLNEVVDRATALENRGKAGAPVVARVREIGSRPGGELPSGSPLLESLRAVDQYLGIRSHLDCSSTDANIPLSLGLPAVSIGVGGQGGGAHTSAEWYSAEGRELGLRRVALAVCRMLTA